MKIINQTLSQFKFKRTKEKWYSSARTGAIMILAVYVLLVINFIC